MVLDQNPMKRDNPVAIVGNAKVNGIRLALLRQFGASRIPEIAAITQYGVLRKLPLVTGSHALPMKAIA